MLEGGTDPIADTAHVSSVGAMMQAGPTRSLHVLRTQLNPDASGEADESLQVRFTGTNEVAYLHVIGGVARFGVGSLSGATTQISISPIAWARLLGRKTGLSMSEITYERGSPPDLTRFFAYFDYPPLT